LAEGGKGGGAPSGSAGLPAEKIEKRSKDLIKNLYLSTKDTKKSKEKRTDI
jgi:hypothetical protein